MNIVVICSSQTHPIYSSLESWVSKQRAQHSVSLVNKVKELTQPAELLFLISCSELVTKATRSLFKKALVIHASDLPEGRGWSPHIWQVIRGADRFAVTMFEAEDAVDSGAIWAQRWVTLEGHELFDEINAKLFAAELELMDEAVAKFDTIAPRAQDTRAPTYFPKRTPEDSRLDPNASLASQFEQLRVADPVRFPAFFEYRGKRYYVQLSKTPFTASGQ